ncbi:MAG: hypothetical protein QXW94_03795 [Desulfurococcaceae archaeon]
MCSIEIDLREAKNSCKEHPIALLNALASEASKRGVSELKIYFNIDVLPSRILELLISKYGYKVVEISHINNKLSFAKAIRAHG